MWRISVIVALLAICGSSPAWAHLGPPYPIMQDRKVGPFTVSVWSNPDVGIGSFFVVIDPPKGGSVPSDMKVQIAVQPVSGRLPEQTYDAWREKLRNRVEFKADVPFDKEEEWRIRSSADQRTSKRRDRHYCAGDASWPGPLGSFALLASLSRRRECCGLRRSPPNGKTEEERNGKRLRKTWLVEQPRGQQRIPTPGSIAICSEEPPK